MITLMHITNLPNDPAISERYFFFFWGNLLIKKSGVIRQRTSEHHGNLSDSTDLLLSSTYE